MCGIIGIISNEIVLENLLEGLKRLEYRGYDSAGIATIYDNKIHNVKTKGKVKNLENELSNNSIRGNIGIAHTRWATHGIPSSLNAHPHVTDKVAVVHNGIIENFVELKDELANLGSEFKSETDTEVIPNLITYYLDQGLSPVEATKKAIKRFTGNFAIAVIFASDENLMLGAKVGAPLIIGYGDNGDLYLGSDSYALSALTDKISYLQDGDMVIMTRDKAVIFDHNNIMVSREIIKSNNKSIISDKGNYQYFMLKEIYEQPQVLRDNIQNYLDLDKNIIKFPEFNFSPGSINKINIIACGTSYYASMIAKYWFEELTNIAVNIDIASEFRYRKPFLEKGQLSIFISQSGETADTLAALNYTKEADQYTLGLVNVSESSIARTSDNFINIQAGIEIGVASTKAFTAQLTSLAILAIYFAREKKLLDDSKYKLMLGELNLVADKISSILELEDQIKIVAKDIFEASSILYIGRNTSYPVALEGALKLKELSYIHAEAIPAGELKHGTIALIDENMFVIAIIPHDKLFEKTLSNLNEIKARGGKIIAFTDLKGKKLLKNLVFRTITLPIKDNFTDPILYVVAMQLLAYHAALLKDCDVDQPRNLAKSVTVE